MKRDETPTAQEPTPKPKPAEAAKRPPARPITREELRKAVERINREFGAGAIMNLGERPEIPVRAVSTGSILVDEALGVGGLPRGRIVEIFGPESSGKTTLALQVIASAQKAGGAAAFVDAEHALDPAYARALGVDLDSLWLSQPGSGEEALEIAECLIRSNEVDVVVVDSVAALVPRAEIEGAMGDAHVGLQARLMSQAMRKLTAALARTSCVTVFINQIREKVGVVFGPAETTPGGRALKFFASVRVEVKKKEQIVEEGRVVGAKTRVKVVKNKLAPPFREALVDVVFSRGICPVAERLNVGLECGVISAPGRGSPSRNSASGRGRPPRGATSR